MRTLVPMLLVLVGCPGEECEQRTASGECFDGDVPENTWVTDLIDGVDVQTRPCELLTPGTDLDLTNGCVDGLCVTDTYSEFVAAWGTPREIRDSDGLLVAEYPRGVDLFFDDDDGDSEIGDSEVPRTVWIQETWRGASPEGLGYGVSMGCFVEALGQPTEVDRVEWDNESFVPEVLEFEAPDTVRIHIYDWHGADGFLDVDGYVDQIVLRQ